ncbi:hypothetical protein OIU85_013917 [Salix viminalis]|uniref:Uncharacterized protein n=1 Tax=Salix viminalis TaxID=40686 RepID=A0A9Q0SD69_SALVM|nr:hypothetical protein OIU85_013917 [Salix viminalis]
MCSETSPRISFSNGLGHDGEIEQVSRRDAKLLDSNSDFEFSICSSLGHESSPADEHFRRWNDPAGSNSRENYCPQSNMRELLVVNSNRLEEKPQSKSFWGFKRCSSLNSDIKRSLCSIPLLLRSSSTGSEPNAKRTTLKDTRKNNSQRHQSASMAKSEPSSSSESSFIYSLPKKPPLKKGGSYGKISPVLSLPPPYIYKGTANLFGLGSFMRNGKEKKIRK